jgi:hypothetical protein
MLFLIGQPFQTLKKIIQLNALSLLQKALQIGYHFCLNMDPVQWVVSASHCVVSLSTGALKPAANFKGNNGDLSLLSS